MPGELAEGCDPAVQASLTCERMQSHQPAGVLRNMHAPQTYRERGMYLFEVLHCLCVGAAVCSFLSCSCMQLLCSLEVSTGSATDLGMRKATDLCS